jgi:hypothetical protein
VSAGLTDVITKIVKGHSNESAVVIPPSPEVGGGRLFDL